MECTIVPDLDKLVLDPCLAQKAVDDDPFPEGGPASSMKSAKSGRASCPTCGSVARR